MPFSIIAAISQNNVISKDNNLPWRIPEDLECFYNMVRGKVIVMGHKTYESIGHPVEDSINIVLSYDFSLKIPGCEVFHSISDVLSLYKGDDREIMIIGGESIYKQFLPFVNKMYLTFIHSNFDGDAYFPKWNKEEWIEVSKRDYKSDLYSYSFVVLKRK